LDTITHAFPTLGTDEMAVIRAMATVRECADGEVVLRAGQADIDFYVVDAGGLEILNPTDDDKTIAFHGPGEFAGDIDLLTRRPIVITAVARGPTRLLRVPGNDLRKLLNTIPLLSEKLLDAFKLRRQLLEEHGTLGLRVVGHGTCSRTTVVREFLFKNFVPHTWFDNERGRGREILDRLHVSPHDEAKMPVVECGDGTVLVNPSLARLAGCAGIRRQCPDRVFDLAVVGAGPAGLAAAVYAASEALSTVVLDKLGPGGQAGGSSRIENFIGFPSGLSGTELATRGVLQMLKFGALLVTPADVTKLLPADADNVHRLQLDDGSTVRARTVLVATGARWRRLPAANADRFERSGVFYACTTVESRLCVGVDVAVVGAGNSAGQAAMFLSDSSRTVHMFVRGTDVAKGMSDYLVARIRSRPNIVVHTVTEVETVHGDQQLTGVTVVDKSTGDRRRVDLRAVFCFIGADPHAQWLPPEVAVDDKGYVLAGHDVERAGRWALDRDPCPLETSLPGVLAAGDVRAGATKRVGFAVGDGSLAVTCVHRLRTLHGWV